MIYEASPIAVGCFFVFVGLTVGLGFVLGRQRTQNIIDLDAASRILALPIVN